MRPLVGRLSLMVASGFGLGYAPVAPGTFGSLLGVLIFLFLARSGPAHYALAWCGITLCGGVASFFAGKILGNADHRRIVADEVSGFLVAAAGLSPSPEKILAAFVLFRLMDVIKPPPAGSFDRMKNVFGVFLDDIVAGVYTAFLLRAGLFLLG